MHKKDAIYLDQLCPKINNKSWRQSLNKITNINAFIAVNHLNHLTTYIQSQKVVKAAQVIAYLVVYHVTARSQIRKYLVGIENKPFTILEDLWQ